MNKDWTLGFISGLIAVAGAFGLLAAFGQVHIYGAGATGLGRLICIW